MGTRAQKNNKKLYNNDEKNGNKFKIKRCRT